MSADRSAAGAIRQGAGREKGQRVAQRAAVVVDGATGLARSM